MSVENKEEIQLPVSGKFIANHRIFERKTSDQLTS